ncbi:MAG: hypothetical protein RJB03_438 [Bacteroidota bacterium]
MKQWIDLNCDMGEGYDSDARIMPFISSANIACGYHAGDENTMIRTISLARKQGVVIGAHPSYPDRENFGRKQMSLSADEVYQLVTDQLRILHDIASDMGMPLHHVKPHGALYNTAASDPAIATAIAHAVADFDARMILYGLANSASGPAAQKLGLKFWNEAFADRTYTDEGLLTPRSETGALIENDEAAIAQVWQMLEAGTVLSTNGKAVTLGPDTICIHGDGAHAVAFAQKIHASLQEKGILIKAV